MNPEEIRSFQITLIPQGMSKINRRANVAAANRWGPRSGLEFFFLLGYNTHGIIIRGEERTLPPAESSSRFFYLEKP
jgi:hypothetical protein